MIEKRTKPGWWVASPILLEIDLYLHEVIVIYEVKAQMSNK
jgi:hypothetical protein